MTPSKTVAFSTLYLPRFQSCAPRRCASRPAPPSAWSSFGSRLSAFRSPLSTFPPPPSPFCSSLAPRPPLERFWPKNIALGKGLVRLGRIPARRTGKII
jgi:hypothetical protein